MKIGVIGVGYVGIAAAYSIFQQKLANELVLIDLNEKRAKAEAMDLMHGQALVGRCQVTGGSDYTLLHNADVIVVAAGVAQKDASETRVMLLERNIKIFGSIVKELDTYCPNAIIIVATNPCEILTTYVQDVSRRAKYKVLGTGTLLDTSRLRSSIAQHYSISSRSVHIYVLGEHGDGQFVSWSTASIAAKPLTEGAVINGITYDKKLLESKAEETTRAAYDIIDGKGYTNLAIGLCCAAIIRSIRDNEKAVLPLSVRLTGEYGIRGICVANPAILGKDGIEALIELPLSPDELASMRGAAKTMSDLYHSVNPDAEP